MQETELRTTHFSQDSITENVLYQIVEEIKKHTFCMVILKGLWEMEDISKGVKVVEEENRVHQKKK